MNEQPKEENKAMACLRCGGAMLECQPHISSGYASTWELWPLDKHLFDTRSSAIRAFVCENCGYTEIQATNVAALLPKPH